jgi:hypothetical protein
MGYEQSVASHAGSRKGSLSTSMTAANHNDIEVL